MASPVTRNSVTGEPRGPLCGIGVCFECRPAGGSRTCLARSPWEPPPAQAEIVVVGGGPAGLAAAGAAADLGAEVVILDENPTPGGQIWRGPSPEAADLADRARQAGARWCGGCSVYDADPVGTLWITDASGMHSARIGFERLVLATGARELFLPFPGWTLPGVVGAGGLQALVKGGADVEGQRVVVAGTGPLLLAVAAFLADRGAVVTSVCEQATLGRLAGFMARSPRLAARAATLRLGLGPSPYRFGTWVVEACGRDRLESVVVTDGRRRWRERCDWLACGYGLVPNLELARLLGCATQGDAVVVDRRLRTTRDRVFAAGEALGIGGVECALVEGEMAGCTAAGSVPPTDLIERRQRARSAAARMAQAFALGPEVLALAGPETLLCRCEDVPLGEVRGCTSFREAKLLTRLGMGPCQGRICGAATRALFGWEADRARPPLIPVSVHCLGSGE